LPVAAEEVFRNPISLEHGCLKMKKWRIEFNDKYTSSPLSYWVHEHIDCGVWLQATVFEPPLPRPIPGKGYPLLIVNALGCELRFASVAEVEHFLAIIRQKNLPTSRQLSSHRSGNHGPNSHWLSRLPSSLKPWSKRQRIIPVVEDALEVFKTICK
jgi:hypothetical protein